MNLLWRWVWLLWGAALLPAQDRLTQIEYYYEHAPEQRLTLAIDAESFAAQEFSLDLTTARSGLNTVFLRLVDAEGLRSPFQMKHFFLQPHPLVVSENPRLVRLEYSYDHAPDQVFREEIDATAWQGQEYSLNLTVANPGMNTVALRMLDDAGVYSVFQIKHLYLQPQPLIETGNRRLVRIDYWFQHDPTRIYSVEVNALAWDNEELFLDLTDAQFGMNTVYLRIVDEAGNSSAFQEKHFYLPSGSIIPEPLRRFSRVDYYYTHLPTKRLSIPVDAEAWANEAFAIDLTDAQAGMNTLYVRIADQDGLYSMRQEKSFYLRPDGLIPDPLDLIQGFGYRVGLLNRVVSSGTISIEPTAYFNGNIVLQPQSILDNRTYTIRIFPLTATMLELFQDGTTSVVPSNQLPLATGLSVQPLAWTTGGNGNWFVQSIVTPDGYVAGQSAKIGAEGVSWVETTLTGPGALAFRWKVSSESGWDSLRLSMDAQVLLSISGETEWLDAQVEIPSGSHVLRWAYTKDKANDVGRDAGWLTDVSFEPLALAEPQSLTASYNDLIDLIALDWKPVEKATAYDVYRSDTDNANAASVIARITRLTYDDYAVNPGFPYTYWVRAVNDAGQSPFSKPATGLRALGDEVEYFLIGATAGIYEDRVIVNWTGFASATQYALRKSETGKFADATIVFQGSTFEWVDEAVELNRSYTYWVSALQGDTVLSLAGPASGYAAESADGQSVVGWGNLNFSQVDNATEEGGAVVAVPASQTVKALPAANYIDLAAGANHAILLREDGSLVATGENRYGQVRLPKDVDISQIASVAAGQNHTLALRKDGTVAAWGRNAFGQSSPPAGLANVVAVAAGLDHSLALKADGTVAAWGSNEFGQSTLPANLATVTAIAAGGDHSLALLADGTVLAWGDNYYGQTDVPAGLKATAIAAGLYHSLALDVLGNAVAWGDNSYGQGNVPATLVRDGVRPRAAAGLKKSIAAGFFNSLVVGDDGSVTAFGRNSSGQGQTPPGINQAAKAAGGEEFNLVLQHGGVPKGLRILPATQKAREGGPALIKVLALASGDVTYQWYKDGQALPSQTSDTLFLASVGSAQAGNYTVEVKNAAGALTSLSSRLEVEAGVVSIFEQSSYTATYPGRFNWNLAYQFFYSGFYPFLWFYQWNGWGYVVGNSEDSYYLYRFDTGKWYWCSASYYPFVLNLSTNGWEQLY